MAVIGNFSTNGNLISGDVNTLTVKMKVRLVSIERSSKDAPDYRILSGRAEVGSAWSKVSNDGEPYISVELDDPSFAFPINAALWPDQADGDYLLVWKRAKSKASQA